MLLLATAGGLVVRAMAATAATLASLSRTGSGLAGAAWVSTDSTVAGCFGLPCGAARSLAGRLPRSASSACLPAVPLAALSLLRPPRVLRGWAFAEVGRAAGRERGGQDV